MAEKKENNEMASQQTAVAGSQPMARPNRDRYKKMMAEDYPDLDFDGDSEGRYGQMVKDRENYNNYKKSGKALSEAFERHSWLAAMFQDLREQPDLDPITWMARNGIDINEAMQDEEYAKGIAKKIGDWQEKQAKDKAADEERTENLRQSAYTLMDLEDEFGLTQEDSKQIWMDFFNGMFEPFMRGEISADNWRMIIKARNYDKDVKTARDEGARAAGNQKVANRVRQSQQGGVPPTLGGGTGERATKKSSGKKESLMDWMKSIG